MSGELMMHELSFKLEKHIGFMLVAFWKNSTENKPTFVFVAIILGLCQTKRLNGILWTSQLVVQVFKTLL